MSVSVNSIFYAPPSPRPVLRLVTAHDWELERFRRGADDSSVSRTKDELLHGAAQQVNACLQRVDDAAAERLGGPLLRMWEALQELLFDDAPTPQVSIDTDGDLQVEFLVNGTSLTLVVDAEGGSLWAVDEDGVELFVEEWLAQTWPYAALAKAGSFLHAMAPDVTVRAPR